MSEVQIPAEIWAAHLIVLGARVHLTEAESRFNNLYVQWAVDRNRETAEQALQAYHEVQGYIEIRETTTALVDRWVRGEDTTTYAAYAETERKLAELANAPGGQDDYRAMQGLLDDLEAAYWDECLSRRLALNDPNSTPANGQQ